VEGGIINRKWVGGGGVFKIKLLAFLYRGQFFATGKLVLNPYGVRTYF
jgi:hypothetical protein